MIWQIREVKIIDLLNYSLLSPALLIALWVLSPLVFVKYIPISPWIIYAVAIFLSYFLLKKSVIGLVLIYKAFAPMSVRNRCRFTPTCSTYMIMAIFKYGLFIGVIKGIHRITRCKPPNGGEDYP